MRALLKEIEVTESSAERNRKIATTSYVRFQARGVDGEREFYSRFYDNLLAAAPEVKHHFKGIDMDRQYSMLNRAIHALLEFDPQSSKVQERMAEMAARHARLGLTHRHYDVFLQTLLKTIEECGETDPARLAAWRGTLTPGIEFMWKCDQKHQLTMPAVLQRQEPNPATPKPKDGQRRGKRPTPPASPA